MFPLLGKAINRTQPRNQEITPTWEGNGRIILTEEILLVACRRTWTTPYPGTSPLDLTSAVKTGRRDHEYPWTKVSMILCSVDCIRSKSHWYTQVSMRKGRAFSLERSANEGDFSLEKERLGPWSMTADAWWFRSSEASSASIMKCEPLMVIYIV